MQRNEAYLLDIVNAGKHILNFGQDLSREDLSDNVEKQSAILYQIIVIGEATKRLSQDFRRIHPEVPWDDMAGMRDRLAHQYDRVNLEVVWTVVRSDIPMLLSLITPLLPPED